MITSLLICLLLPLQSAPAGHDPAVPAAVPTDKPAAAEPAAPTETPEAVRKFLKDAEALLYDPQAEGLVSLEFDVPIDMPQVGVIGSTHVSWTAAGGPVFTIDHNGAAALPPGMPAEMTDVFGRQMGMQLLGYMLNKPITPLLDGSVASMAGVEDGMVKVAVHNAAAEKQGVQEQSLFFDDAGLLQRVRTVGDTDGGPMGKVKVHQVQNFTWKPAKEGDEHLVEAGQKSVADMGIMKITAETSFSYGTAAGFVLPTVVAMKQNTPMGAMTQNLSATNLKVNGQAAGG